MAYQIPPEVAHFVDREDEQERARSAVAAREDGRARPLCLALNGLGGTGKTELAFRIARQVREHHPDGVLYVDLDDLRRDGAVEVADVLGELLRALEVQSEWLKPTLAGRTKQYWEVTYGKRLVVVLDNARRGSEVLPLLPASGGSTAIVASHGPLLDLADGTALDVPLDPLPEEHAGRLLRLLAPDPRLAADPDAVTEFVRLCSGLPAAVHVAARWLRRHRRRPLARLLTELTAELHDQGLPMVERVWNAAYRALDPDAALLYRLLAAHPGPAFTPASATALLGRGPDAADEALERLEEAGLLDARDVLGTGGEQLRLPGLLRAHAGRRARDDGGGEEAAAGRRRLLRWYLRQAQRADALAAGSRMTFGETVPEQPGAPDVPFADKPHAYRWLEAERHALYGCVAQAYADGLDGEAWALCEPLWTHYLDHPHHADIVDAFGTGLAAAQRAGRVPALVRMRCQLARPLWEQGDFAEAGRQMEQAHAALGALGDAPGERKLAASAVEFRGMLSSARGEWAAAAADFETARETHRALGNDYGAMLQTYRLGEALAALGEPDRAAALLEEAHAAASALGRERMTARTGFALGGVLRRLGRTGEARELFLRSLESARERGAEYDEVRVLEALAGLAEEEGDVVGAREARERARTIRARNGAAADPE